MGEVLKRLSPETDDGLDVETVPDELADRTVLGRVQYRLVNDHRPPTAAPFGLRARVPYRFEVVGDGSQEQRPALHGLVDRFLDRLAGCDQRPEFGCTVGAAVAGTAGGLEPPLRSRFGQGHFQGVDLGLRLGQLALDLRELLPFDDAHRDHAEPSEQHGTVRSKTAPERLPILDGDDVARVPEGGIGEHYIHPPG